MATILAIDTSATPVSCAIVKDGRVLCSYFSHSGQTHSQTLMPMVEKALADVNLTVNGLDALAVNAGPGSFTGVRIGVATVKGLAFSHQLPCVSVSTLESMAEAFSGMPGEATIACVMDARCQQVYGALFALRQGIITRLTADEAMSIDSLGELLQKEDKPVILTGDGSELCHRTLADSLPKLCLAPLSLRYQHAASVAAVAQRLLADGKAISAETLLPTYLRLPQAERELRQRQLVSKSI